MWKDKTEQLLTQVNYATTYIIVDIKVDKKIVFLCSLFFLSFFLNQITDRPVPVQVSLVAEERDQNINRVQELEACITELKNAAGKRFK